MSQVQNELRIQQGGLTMKPITLEEAKNLHHGQVLYHRYLKDSQKAPQRWRVSGKVKIWKRSPERVKVPIKWGLWGYDYITDKNLENFSLDASN
jgi:hypothetical protein